MTSLVIDSIFQLEREMMAFPNEVKIELDVIHTFAPGTYVRTAFLSKGTLVVGKIHLHEHANIISFGDVAFASYDGIKRMTGFNSFATPPGVKRVVLALEDTVWTTVHHNPTDERDLKVLESMIIADGYDESLVEKMQEYFEKAVAV